MRIKERHISGAFVDVKGDSFAELSRFVHKWRKQVDEKTTVEPEPESEPPGVTNVVSQIGFQATPLANGVDNRVGFRA